MTTSLSHSLGLLNAEKMWLEKGTGGLKYLKKIKILFETVRKINRFLEIVRKMKRILEIFRKINELLK
jgi:hypothetical protein